MPLKKQEVDFKETYPLDEKKFVIYVTLNPITWQGDRYLTATPKYAYCCEEAKGLDFKRNNIGSNFLKVLYQDQPIDVCPFCGAKIEVHKDENNP